MLRRWTHLGEKGRHILLTVAVLSVLGVGVWLWQHPIVGVVMRDQFRLLLTRDEPTSWVLLGTLSDLSAATRRARERLQQFVRQLQITQSVARCAGGSAVRRTTAGAERASRHLRCSSQRLERWEIPRRRGFWKLV